MSGCHKALNKTPNLVFGVLSDVHVTTKESTRMLETAYAYFKKRSVDAVMIPGDITDWGNRKSLQYFKESWDKFFKGGQVVPLFCTGNHDYEGWRYPDMYVEMLANGYDENDAMLKCGGVFPVWREVLGDDISQIRVRNVKGYDFISTEWNAQRLFPEWWAENSNRFKGKKPFFYFQHLPIPGATGDAPRYKDSDFIADSFAEFPNAVAFTGHYHTPFYNETAIAQKKFTAISVPSLSYVSLPRNYENGNGLRNGESKQSMVNMMHRHKKIAGTGFLVSVYEDEMVVERIDFNRGGETAADAWIVPLSSGAKPFDIASRAEKSIAPEFPANAKFEVETTNGENRVGCWAIMMDCLFDAAVPQKGCRVYDYEITAVLADGTTAMRKRFLSPAYGRLEEYEPKKLNFWFDVMDLPQGADYRLEVRARNEYGKKSSTRLVSKVFHSIPQKPKTLPKSKTQNKS
jgi:hypothetical protein